MRARAAFSALAAAACAASAAARPAAAQVIAASDTEVRTVATFKLAAVGRRHTGAPERLTVADSAGQLVGHLWVVGSATPLPMAVTVEGGDLVMRADSRQGRLEYVLYRQNERTQRSLVGRWTVGPRNGDIRGMLSS